MDLTLAIVKGTWTADEIAECMSVSRDTYKQLWDTVHIHEGVMLRKIWKLLDNKAQADIKQAVKAENK